MDDSINNDLINFLLKKNLRGELYDLTFTSKQNVTGKLKSKQEGTTLTLEKAIHELLIIEQTSIDDKSEKRELRKNFLIRCYYEDDLKCLFELYTEFLNGGENTTSPFIINVSGGNLIILFAWLIKHINLVKKEKIDPLNIGADKLQAQFKKIMSREISQQIIESADLIVENGFSDLDFYIIENSKCNRAMNITGGVNTPPQDPAIRRSKRQRTPTVSFSKEQGDEIHANKIRAEQIKKQNIKKAKEKVKQEKKAMEQAKAEKKKNLEDQKKANQKKADELKEAIEEEKKTKSNEVKIEKFEKKDNQGFIVYRIKTGVFLEDYLDIVLKKNDPDDPKEFKELKNALLDLFIFNIENKDYNPFDYNVTEEDYKKLHGVGLPETIGTGTIGIYPQLFQQKYLDIPGLSVNCKKHLKYLDYQKRILEKSKKLNIFLLLVCLEEKYKTKINYINLILFLHDLCKKINNRLEYVTKDDSFKSLDSLKDSKSVNDIINKARQILIEDEITKSLKKKLIELFGILPSFVKLVSSRTTIENDPQVDDVLIYIPDEYSEHFDDNELLEIDDDIFFDDIFKDKIEEYNPLPPPSDKEAGYKKKIGKKLKKSKKKRKVNKKTKNKHNKKNKRTRRKKNNKTEKKLRK